MRRSLAIVCFFLSMAPAEANSGFGGLTATGLTFSKTFAVEIVREDLSISPSRISVDYVFRNKTDQDVTGEMIFPLPPLSLQFLGDYWPLLKSIDRDNLVNFTVEVNGASQEVMIGRMAVIPPEQNDRESLSSQYQSPGRDVTEELRKFGIPISLDRKAVRSAIFALGDTEQSSLLTKGIIDEVQTPQWSVVLRYHWQQTFPANTTVRIHQEYENYPAGGEFSWLHSLKSPRDDLTMSEQKQLVDVFCIRPEGANEIYGALKSNGEFDYRPSVKLLSGGALYTSYVLRTANTWAGPIGTFRLTVDKEDPRNLVFTCFDDMKQSGPTSYSLERSQFTPESDLELLMVIPVDSWMDREVQP